MLAFIIAALVTFTISLVGRKFLLWLLDSSQSNIGYFNINQKYPPANETVLVLFKDLSGRKERRPIKCRLSDNYEYPEWVLPDGKTRGLVFTVGWRHCTDQIPDHEKINIINPFDRT